MQLFAFAPLPVGVLLWNDPEPCVTVITKLTLAYGRSGFVIAGEPEPLCHAVPSLFGSPDELHHPDDFVPRKARCDVLLSGSAYAAMALSAIGARIRVGAFQKRFFALAGQSTTAIPLSAAYLREKPGFDSAVVSVGTLSPEHPERARHAAFALDASAAGLRRVALPRAFDFGFFNVAPGDQQIDPIGPGTSLSLEGLSPDGAPCSGQLPHEWPEIHGLARDGQLTEIPLTCDTLWIDTDRNVCELTLRGSWRAPLPIGLAVGLRDVTQRRAPLLFADLARAVKGRALSPDEVEQVAEAADTLEEIEPVEVIEPAARVAAEAPALREIRGMAEEATVAAPAQMPTAEAPPRPALGRLGAFQLQQARPVEMPALPRDPRGPDGVPDGAAPDGGGRRRRPQTLDILPGSSLEGRAPFPIAPAAARAAHVDGATARARFLALTMSGAPPSTPRPDSSPRDALTQLGAPAAPVEALAEPARDPSPLPPPSRAPQFSLPPSSRAPLFPPPLPEVAVVAPPRRTIGESMRDAPAPVVRVEAAVAPAARPVESSIPLATYAAIKAEIWGDREPVTAELARRGIDEVAWYENERRLAEALAREAREGGSKLATELQRALRTACDERSGDGERPLRAFEDAYVKLLAVIDRAEDPSAAIAAKGMTPAEWRNIHRRFLARAGADARARDGLATKLAAARKAAGDDGAPLVESSRWIRREPAPPGARRVVSKKPR